MYEYITSNRIFLIIDKDDKGGLFAKPKDVLEMVEDLMDVDLPLEKILPTPISLDHAKIKRLTES